MNPVQLMDGTVGDSSSEAWRHECEARAILAMPRLDQRRAFLAGVEKKRGEAARLALQKTMTALWRRREQ